MSPRPASAFVVGEALIDVVVDGDRRDEHPGGSPMNVAYGLARLGVPTVFRSVLGRDARGDAIARHLAESAATLDPASLTDSPTSTAVATIQADRHAEYTFDIAWNPGPLTASQDATLIHAGSIASALEPGSDDVRRLFDSQRTGTALLSFDPNVRPGVTPSRPAVVAAVEALAASAHVVKLSDEDAAWLFPSLSADAVLDWFLSRGAALAAMTRGGDGALVASGADRLSLPSLPVEVVDTIGAGDSFMSGLLWAILDRGLAPKLRAGVIVRSDLEAVAAVALQSARVTVSRAGANPPTPAELAAP
ncbi:hypothetical protein AX769_00160 [Frondihabitans sp. PAMC 28766]|nr:hypothetical protein AX769_00160 [Frondihabitans sp. PAMC 28766]